MTKITDIWSARSKMNGHALILPDGCRDMIIKVHDDKPAHWLISPLYDHTETVITQHKPPAQAFVSKQELILLSMKMPVLYHL